MYRILLTFGLVLNLFRISQEFSIRKSRKFSTKPYQDLIVRNAISHAPRGSRLINYSTGPISTQKLARSLINNATAIRKDIKGGFDCSNRVYGYYADTNNECQVFHLCVNLHQLFPDIYRSGELFQFSFICPKYTIFTQDAMVCAWERSAVPCELAPQLYYLNNNFFVIPSEKEDFKKIPTDSKTKD